MNWEGSENAGYLQAFIDIVEGVHPGYQPRRRFYIAFLIAEELFEYEHGEGVEGFILTEDGKRELEWMKENHPYWLKETA